jgi:hypothetical protein
MIMGLKLIVNCQRYIRTRIYFKRYKKYIEDPTWDFHEYKHQFIKLFKDAGINDSLVPVVNPVGMGLVQTANVSFFSNVNITREDIVNLMIKSFHEAIGVYRSRIIETFNPLFWLEFVVFLPMKIFKYLSLNVEKRGYKVIQVIYWLFSILIGLVSFLNENFRESIWSRINSIF